MNVNTRVDRWILKPVIYYQNISAEYSLHSQFNRDLTMWFSLQIPSWYSHEQRLKQLNHFFMVGFIQLQFISMFCAVSVTFDLQPQKPNNLWVRSLPATYDLSVEENKLSSSAKRSNTFSFFSATFFKTSARRPPWEMFSVCCCPLCGSQWIYGSAL